MCVRVNLCVEILYVCIHIYMYTDTCIQAYIHTLIHANIQTKMHACIKIDTYMHAFMHTQIQTRKISHVRVWGMRVCVRVCVCVCALHTYKRATINISTRPVTHTNKSCHTHQSISDTHQTNHVMHIIASWYTYKYKTTPGISLLVCVSCYFARKIHRIEQSKNLSPLELWRALCLLVEVGSK